MDIAWSAPAAAPPRLVFVDIRITLGGRGGEVRHLEHKSPNYCTELYSSTWRWPMAHHHARAAECGVGDVSLVNRRALRYRWRGACS